MKVDEMKEEYISKGKCQLTTKISQPMEEVDQHPHPLHPMEPATKRSRASETLTLTLAKSTDNVLTKHTFTEAIDHKMLQRMIDSGVLYRTNDGGWMDREYGCTEEQQLQKILKKVKGGTLKVSYKKPKCGFGRVNPKGSLSLGSLRKAVRHTLCGDDWWDFDVAKCHHDILRQLCQNNGLPCPALAHAACTAHRLIVTNVTISIKTTLVVHRHRFVSNRYFPILKMHIAFIY